ncbi:ribbon-helix-helix protein, CopG family [Synechocystis sp. PCC 6714]|nr:ribbon-helix-helix domain-containing protein [Synechocystis sp. CS-94]
MAIRNKRIQVVLSEAELDQFRQYAERKGVSMSEILRDYIKLVSKPS